MYYAPIIITAFDRLESLQRLISSLEMNELANETDIYIGLDYPGCPDREKKYKLVKDYLSGSFPAFKSFHVIHRDKNYGHKKNVEDMIKQVSGKYDRWIVMGDDLEASPNFIRYMDEMLCQYKEDSSVVAVTGFSYPVKWNVKSGCNVVKQSFTANDWGIGFWKDTYYEMLKYFRGNGLQKSFVKSYESDFRGMTNWAITDYVNGVCSGITPHSYLFGVFDVSVRLYLSVKEKYVIMPILSKIRNWGFDGSGINCRKTEIDSDKEVTSSNYDFSHQPIDTESTFVPQVDSEFDVNLNRKLLNQFDYVKPSVMDDTMTRAAEYARHGNSYRYVVNIKHILAKVFHVLKRRK